MKIYTMKSVEQGFTLIEVLISSVILFSSIALTSQLYNQIDYLSKKASNSMVYNQIGNVAIDLVKTKIQNSKLASNNRDIAEGSEMINGVSFLWTARLVRRVKPPRDIDDIIEPKERFSVFKVTIMISQKQNVEFNVVVWD
ncbi:prepilin-type N-terminal cleavage/methylation domain-containing protein [Pseudoalteromonas xiamenensis]|uniref:prepilin-type N-terminal cleavage/methylation domain-containing protein n=1 Tax=Pseudoalteromonas xiamenensis TaxID=882626 RepID=UPI0027E57F6D|nr:prepilin-type N-terminal cleavage/methylation domain-containing protein [Pseudoalteromonas xiamenensis]WMN61214.1 prepilin-type N-terminal cleavage/methylation domain-containing protein [Pseudoalteromonas xiamenensis]